MNLEERLISYTGSPVMGDTPVSPRQLRRLSKKHWRDSNGDAHAHLPGARCQRCRPSPRCEFCGYPADEPGPWRSSDGRIEDTL